MIDAISSIAAASGAVAPQLDAGQGVQAESGFAHVFEAQLGKVNTDLALAETSLQRLAAGESIELHDVMIALETARIGVQTMVQVRNRMVEAYQELMRMQI